MRIKLWSYPRIGFLHHQHHFWGASSVKIHKPHLCYEIKNLSPPPTLRFSFEKNVLWNMETFFVNYITVQLNRKSLTTLMLNILKGKKTWPISTAFDQWPTVNFDFSFPQDFTKAGGMAWCKKMLKRLVSVLQTVVPRFFRGNHA